MVQDIRTVEGLTLKGGNEYSEAYLSQLEDFFVNAPVGALIVDGNHRILRANSTVLEVLGIKDEQRALGRVIFDLFEGVPRSVLEPAITSPGTLVTNVRAQIRAEGGKTEQVFVDANARFREDGTLVYSRWFVRPVEARVLPSDERDVDNPTASLSDEMKRERFLLLNDFFENAPVGVHFVGLNGLILRSNLEEKKLLGYGTHPSEYDGIHVSKIHWDKKKIELLLSRLAESVPVIDEKAFMLKKDGSIFIARIYSGLRLKGGAFENTRCFLFADENQAQEPVEMQEYSFPRFDDFGDA